MTIIYRELRGKEMEKCAHLIHELSWGHDYPVNALDELNKADFVLGAFDNDNLVGCASINKFASPDGIDNGKDWFAGAVVKPNHRKQGIFRQLYNKRLEYAKSENIKEVYSCTDNPIIESFLLKEGWKEIRKTKDEQGNHCKVFKKTIIT